jgi:hypothetical protein
VKRLKADKMKEVVMKAGAPEDLKQSTFNVVNTVPAAMKITAPESHQNTTFVMLVLLFTLSLGPVCHADVSGHIC